MGIQVIRSGETNIGEIYMVMSLLRLRIATPKHLQASLLNVWFLDGESNIIMYGPEVDGFWPTNSKLNCFTAIKVR